MLPRNDRARGTRQRGLEAEGELLTQSSSELTLWHNRHKIPEKSSKIVPLGAPYFAKIRGRKASPCLMACSRFCEIRTTMRDSQPDLRALEERGRRLHIAPLQAEVLGVRRKMLFGVQLRDFDAGYERKTAHGGV